jgi:hypothetical protein
MRIRENKTNAILKMAEPEQEWDIIEDELFNFKYYMYMNRIRIIS